MNNSDKDEELSNFQAFIALAVVFLLFIGVFLLFAHFSDNGEVNNNFGSCDTRLDPTACPEPDYEPSNEELRNQPDAEPPEYSPDRCGDYSCEQLEKEAKEEMDQTDREIERDLQERGLE